MTAVLSRTRDPELLAELSRRLVPDEMWLVIEPLLPAGHPRPQGGGRTRVGDRTVFTAIVFIVTTGCAWRHLPPLFGVTVPTAHRRFCEWTEAGLWSALDHAVRGELSCQCLIDWYQTILDNVSVRAGRQSAC